jgi:hypothetical protein
VRRTGPGGAWMTPVPRPPATDLSVPAEPALLHPAFGAVLTELIQSGGMDSFRQTDDHVVTALKLPCQGPPAAA